MLKSSRLIKMIVYILSCTVLVATIKPVKAEKYAFNRHVGKVYVEDVNVDFEGNGVNLSVAIRTPTCPNQYHINGYVQVVYTNGRGRALRTWTFNGSDQENRRLYFSDFRPYRQTPGGRVNVQTFSQCIYHRAINSSIRIF